MLKNSLVPASYPQINPTSADLGASGAGYAPKKRAWVEFSTVSHDPLPGHPEAMKMEPSP